MSLWLLLHLKHDIHQSSPLSDILKLRENHGFLLSSNIMSRQQL